VIFADCAGITIILSNKRTSELEYGIRLLALQRNGMICNHNPENPEPHKTTSLNLKPWSTRNCSHT